jgi:hypothetical protein
MRVDFVGLAAEFLPIYPDAPRGVDFLIAVPPPVLLKSPTEIQNGLQANLSH